MPYHDGHEQLPRNMLEPRGLGFRVIAYCDADYAGDLLTIRSRSGFVVYLKKICQFIVYLEKE